MGEPTVSGEKGLRPCPNCGAPWQRTELLSEARRGGGYRVLCHVCEHEWDDMHASHAARDTASRQRARSMLDRQNEAYRHSPCGTWAQRWIPGVCKHSEVRCTHGDEIIGRRYRRRVCMVCGRALAGPLPAECFFTGEPHPSTAADFGSRGGSDV